MSATIATLAAAIVSATTMPALADRDVVQPERQRGEAAAARSARTRTSPRIPVRALVLEFALLFGAM